MSWSKIKTMLIVLFVFVNAFLLYNSMNPGNSSEISQQTVNETVQILEANGVKIEPSTIKRKPETLRKAEISNSIESRSKLAGNMLGNCNETENGYISDTGKIVFSSVAFSYENFDSSIKKEINEGNAVSVAAEMLNEKKLGVESSWVQDFSVNEKGYEVRFGKKINGYSVYESFVTVKISPEGVLETVEGYWPEVVINEASAGTVKFVGETTVLINLLSAEGFDLEKENEVVDIHTGYSLGGLPESNNPILLTALPAYRIVLKNGENYIFDGENGEFIYKY